MRIHFDIENLKESLMRAQNLHISILHGNFKAHSVFKASFSSAVPENIPVWKVGSGSD